MWIAMNDSFVSVVKNQQDKGNKTLMVRARVKEDLENLCPGKKIIVTPTSDYRFRVVITREEFADIMANRVENINYNNFKNSVKEDWRHNAYLKIWTTMYNVQEDKYEREYRWWENYQHYPYYQTPVDHLPVKKRKNSKKKKVSLYKGPKNTNIRNVANRIEKI